MMRLLFLLFHWLAGRLTMNKIKLEYSLVFFQCHQRATSHVYASLKVYPNVCVCACVQICNHQKIVVASHFLFSLESFSFSIFVELFFRISLLTHVADIIGITRRRTQRLECDTMMQKGQKDLPGTSFERGSWGDHKVSNTNIA